MKNKEQFGNKKLNINGTVTRDNTRYDGFELSHKKICIQI